MKLITLDEALKMYNNWKNKCTDYVKSDKNFFFSVNKKNFGQYCDWLKSKQGYRIV